MSAPFAGVRVVDALGGLLGGYCTKLLADAGAEVILLEGPDGDELRTWRVGGGPDGGALFDHLRAGQQAVRADDPEAVTAWARSADCIVVGPDGPDPGVLAAADPALVAVSITPYGRSGPWADRPVTDFTLQADAGGLTIRGRPDRPPYHAGGRMGDWFTA
ncbi:MAG: CoA transferase, partial [Actinobacteria bacterium]|nr:CoA transferase [Actinomycetota bacterium]NIS32425.1 CoA transferase [Actinomycetota bacterium]NIT96248.1 CoA transferase [Actinomycetota bacterium]NIU19941.1 CoA transferase [Actinomycetota bacterium]NIU67447.1 CoA transferase [Actinomycetota bacterium]